MNYLHEVDGFYNEMMAKLKSLRSSPSLQISVPDRKVVKELDLTLIKRTRNTPAVQEKLKYIQKLEDELKETVEVYQMERAERLQMQNEICNDICKDALEKDSRLFLELCHFETNSESNLDEVEKAEEESKGENMTLGQKKNQSNTSFIKRNIELARSGIMAGCSLTDEEKRKLEELLSEEQDDPDNENDPDRRDSGFCMEETEDFSEDENYMISNAYMMSDDERRKMENINFELEKFTLDEAEKEKVDKKPSKHRQTDWKDNVLVEQRMKSINAELEEIRNAYERAQNDLRESKTEKSSSDESSEAENSNQCDVFEISNKNGEEELNE